MKQIAWNTLGFHFTETDSIVRSAFHGEWKDGKLVGQWDEPYLTRDKYLHLHVSATCLQYGQEAFEGLKVFRGADRQVRVFRWQANAERLQRSAEALKMAAPPVELFGKAMRMVIADNADYIPPYETGATLYLRPLLIGTTPRLGVGPGKDFELIIVDDGSPDNCGTIADEYSRKDSRVRVIHKENGGAPSARNAGMEIAEGEYFYFPDSDDWLELTYLQELYDLAQIAGRYRCRDWLTEECLERLHLHGTDERDNDIAYNIRHFLLRQKGRYRQHQYFDEQNSPVNIADLSLFKIMLNEQHGQDTDAERRDRHQKVYDLGMVAFRDGNT